MLAAGRMDRRIKIERAMKARDSTGQLVPVDWLPHAKVWAQREFLDAREQFVAQQFAAKVDTRFRIRHSSDVADVKPKDFRVVDGDRVYDITGVLEIGRREGLELLAYARAEA